jgi:hypothetical protein
MGACAHLNLKDPTISKTFKCAFQIHINILQCTQKSIKKWIKEPQIEGGTFSYKNKQSVTLLSEYVHCKNTRKLKKK